MGLILDTNFLVNLERETTRSAPGPAYAFLSANPKETLYITFTIAGEIACGKSLVPKVRWEQFCLPYTVLGYSPEVAWQYGELFRHLMAQGNLIGANDLWIAATALVNHLPLVTRDTGHFGRVAGLRILTY